jgi:two-component system nitrate/nitrite response regulator NarL
MKPAEKTIRVLLVDDHQTMLWGLDKLIEGQRPGMEVVGVATSCAEALAKVRQLVPDVILLDLDLGGTSALDILPALLSNSVSRALILTGEREQAKLDLAVKLGARGVLRKDASAEQVLKAIEKTHAGELWLDHGTLSRVFGEFMNTKVIRKLDPEPEKKAALTARERKVISVLVDESGASNKAIAQRLFISEHTLRNHLTSIYHKLDVMNRLELYVYAVKHQLGSSSPNWNPGGAAGPAIVGLQKKD